MQQKSVLPQLQLCREWAEKKLPTMQDDFTHNAVLPTRWHSIYIEIGGVLGHLDLDSLTIFIWGGILGHLDLDSDNFYWGGILGHSDLDSLTIFILGGGEGEGEGGILQNRGILWDLDQNFNHSSRLMHHR